MSQLSVLENGATKTQNVISNLENSGAKVSEDYYDTLI